MKTKLILAAISVSILSIATAGFCEEAKVIWGKKCAACHGQDGKGDTKMGKKLEAPDYSNPKVQAKMKDEEMFKAIKEGIKKGEDTKMKAFGGKLTDDEIRSLVAYIRSLKK